MRETRWGSKVPYGKRSIGRLRVRDRETDAQVTDVGRSGPMAGSDHATYHGVPPVKPAPFEIPYIPLYFWVGGIAAGSWLAVTAEIWTGDDDRTVVRAGRFVTLGSVLAGTGLLITDLGRPERFLNMLRVFRSRSPMSLGSWALSTFGACAGAAALVQAAEDGWLGRGAAARGLAALSRDGAGRTLHLAALPAALFVGSYTGVLLSATSTPSWATRAGTLSRLFVASATSSGLAAVSAALELTGGTRPSTAGRLARAQAASLAAEGALHLLDERKAKRVPSFHEAGAGDRALRLGTLVAGIAVPLALNALEARRSPAEAEEHAATGDAAGGGSRPRRRSVTRLVAAGLALAGSLALRFTTVKQGDRSANTPEDTWAYAGNGARTRNGGTPDAGERPSAPARLTAAAKEDRNAEP